MYDALPGSYKPLTTAMWIVVDMFTSFGHKKCIGMKRPSPKERGGDIRALNVEQGMYVVGMPSQSQYDPDSVSLLTTMWRQSRGAVRRQISGDHHLALDTKLLKGQSLVIMSPFSHIIREDLDHDNSPTARSRHNGTSLDKDGSAEFHLGDTAYLSPPSSPA